MERGPPPTFPAVAYNGINQTKSITPAGQAAVAMEYAGSGQAERTSAGGTTARNGLLGVEAETTGGQETAYRRDAGGGLVLIDGPLVDDYYFYFDGFGSVIGLVDPSGNQRATYSYDPFGSHATATAVNGLLPTNPWRWMGGYLDSTGLYHFGERYYEPAAGRFLQVDPIAGGSANAYGYCGGDPVNCLDLDGRKMTWRTALGHVSTGLSIMAAASRFTTILCSLCALGLNLTSLALDTGLAIYDCKKQQKTCRSSAFSAGANGLTFGINIGVGKVAPKLLQGYSGVSNMNRNIQGTVDGFSIAATESLTAADSWTA